MKMMLSVDQAIEKKNQTFFLEKVSDLKNDENQTKFSNFSSKYFLIIIPF